MAPPAPRSSSKPDILISIAVAPLLLALVSTRFLGSQGIAWGRASEEIFRGDRLPTLH
jgi:hypothetical protein